jgi:peroxiredoxin Q/BCP
MKSIALVLVAFTLVPIVPWAPLARQAGDPARPSAPKVGAPAPTGRLNDHTGRAVSIGKSERWTVLAFYPKAMTSGCTREVCSLRDSADVFTELGVDVYGVSLDDVQDQAKFAKEQNLAFKLLSDPDGSIATKYAVLAGERPYPKRVTFVIDPAGVLRAIDEKVQVESHGADLAALVRKLQAG